jgi:hypothetical protein
VEPRATRPLEIRLLITASIFRDTIPWIYELGVDAYREATSSTTGPALRRFVWVVRLLGGNLQLLQEYDLDPKAIGLAFSEIQRLVATARKGEILENNEAAQEPSQPA